MLDTVCADVEPVPSRECWFQLTGQNIRRSVAFDEFLEGCKTGVDEPVSNAHVLGIHDQQAILCDDDRFNGKDSSSFAVIKRQNGTYFMVLEVHMPEANLFRFVIPASRPELDEPLPRIEPGASLREGSGADQVFDSQPRSRL